MRRKSSFNLASSVLIWIFGQRKTKKIYSATEFDSPRMIFKFKYRFTYINLRKMNESWNRNAYTPQTKIIFSLNWMLHWSWSKTTCVLSGLVNSTHKCDNEHYTYMYISVCEIIWWTLQTQKNKLRCKHIFLDLVRTAFKKNLEANKLLYISV